MSERLRLVELSSSATATLVLCFCAILLDGFDTGSIGVAGPAIARHLNVPVASLTIAFVMTSVGAVIGYLTSGHIVDLWGARLVLIASVTGFGALSLAAPLAGSLPELAALRLVTAIGLGAALPAAISVVVERSPQRLREATTIIVGTGLAVGGVLGGLLGGIATNRYGWEYLFYIGGILPLALALCLKRWLPRPIPTQNRSFSIKPRRDGIREYVHSVKSLLSGPLGGRTACLWAFSFLIFSDAYALMFWIPPLLIKFGVSIEQAPFGVAMFSFGGLIANLLLLLLACIFAVPHILIVAASSAGLCILGLALHSTISFGVWIAIAGAGAGLIACSIGQSALAVSLYPEPLRTTGIGFSAALGRIGSIVGPGAAGVLFSSDWKPETIAISAIMPILLALVVLVLFASLDRRRRIKIGVLGV